MPEAVTLNVAVCPAVTIWLAGCDAIVGTAGLFPLFELLDEITPAHPANASAATIALASNMKVGRRTGVPSCQFERPGWVGHSFGEKRTDPRRDAAAMHTHSLTCSLISTEGNYT